MFTTKLTLLGALLALVLAGPPAGRAEVRGLALGEAGLPTMVGGFKLIRFNRDTRPSFTVVSSVPAPTGGELTFTEPQLCNPSFPACSTLFVGRYRPLQLPQNQIIMELPARTRAFYFETAHGLGSYYHISALVDEDLDTLRQQGVNGGFACGTFAYWLDSPHDPPMRRIRVNLAGADGPVAVGEFAIYVPPDLPGDMNCDARVDFDDVAGFVLAAIGEEAFLEVYPGCVYSNADTNGDGLVNFDDIDGFVLRLAGG